MTFAPEKNIQRSTEEHAGRGGPMENKMQLDREKEKGETQLKGDRWKGEVERMNAGWKRTDRPYGVEEESNEDEDGDR